MTHCKNCGNTFEGKFCNICGQKSGVRRLDWHFVLENIQHTIFHLDYGLLFTVRQLFVQPGIAIREYMAGKRIRYTSPLTYLIIVSFVFYFFKKVTNTEGDLVYISRKAELMAGFINSYYDKIVLVILIPLSVVFTRLLFPRNHYNFFEWFAFYCFVRAQFLLIELIVDLLDMTLVQLNIFLHPVTILVLVYLLNTIFMGWSLWQFLALKSFWMSLLKSLALIALLSASGAFLGLVANLVMAGLGIN